MSFLKLILIYCQYIYVQGFFHEHSIKIYQQPSFLSKNSLFGYSIAFQNHSLIVSDPIADGVGSLYLLDVDTPDGNSSAVALLVNDLRRKKLKDRNVKHEYWFGASVVANNDFFLSCAPRYAELKTLEKPTFSTVGTCYLKRHNEAFRRLQTLSADDRLRTEKRKVAFMDSFGWSTHITSQNEILIGGPAISKGRVIKHHTPMSKNYPKMFDKISRSNPVLYNFGYSIASGNFFGPEMSYAVSTTFGDLGFGKVYFFNSKLDNIGAIKDNIFSSMFGAALCSAKLPATALVVGAPVYSESNTDYDVGAVYIYMANTEFSSNEMFLKQKIKGISIGGYFGNSILNLGDLNGDSYDEVAIAAPYEKDGNGVIYIYTGKGLLEGKHTQRIQLDWFKNFGFSMTIVPDYDGNGCNELAVSSPSSDRVVMLTSFAFITVKLRAVFPKNITPGENFEFESCVDVIYPTKPKKIETDLILTIQSTFPNATLSRRKVNGHELIYEQSLETKKSSYCEKIGVETPSTVEKEHNLVLAYKISANQKVNPLDLKDFKTSRVLLSENSVLNVENSIYAGICDSGRCVPKLDLATNCSIMKPYIIGSTDEETLTLSVSNSGDTAYSSCILVSISKSRFSRYPQECFSQSSNKLLCKPRFSLKNKGNWIIKDVLIDTTYLTSLDDNLDITYDLYDSCSDLSSTKTQVDTFTLLSDYDGVFIKGEIIPEKIVNMTMSDLEHGKIIEHRYTLLNNGKTNWINVQSEIFLENGPFVKYSEAAITINTGLSLIECPIILQANETKDNITVACDIANLKVNDKVIVAIAIEIPPNIIDKRNYNKNFTVSTGINIIMKEQNIDSSLQTILRVQRSDVPLWVIIISSVIGLILVGIIGFILYKSGFLKRKKKDQLVRLRKSVYRQSMRRTAMRESIRATTSRKSSEDVRFLVSQECSIIRTDL